MVSGFTRIQHRMDRRIGWQEAGDREWEDKEESIALKLILDESMVINLLSKNFNSCNWHGKKTNYT